MATASHVYGRRVGTYLSRTTAQRPTSAPNTQTSLLAQRVDSAMERHQEEQAIGPLQL
jgi:hypothetical protein